MNIVNWVKEKLEERKKNKKFMKTLIANANYLVDSDDTTPMTSNSKRSKKQKLPIVGSSYGNDEINISNSRGIMISGNRSAESDGEEITENPIVSDDEKIPKTAKFAKDFKKPIEVVQDLYSNKPEMNLKDIDKQIEIVKTRKDLLEKINSNGVNEDIIIGFLEARKKYKEYYQEFNWKVTTRDKILEFLKKYLYLEKVPINDFTPCVPTEALEELDRFITSYKKIRPDEEPVIEIICPKKDISTKDPILLAYSPFGNWWYVLGAWDKEVDIVDDIIFKFK